MRVTSEVFFHPLFEEGAIEKERIAIIDEIKQRMDSHYYPISKFFLKERFKKNHPLLLDGGGRVETLEKITKEDMLKYWREYFIPSNTYLHVSGNFENDNLLSQLNKYFASHQNEKKFTGFPVMTNSDFTERKISLRSDKKLQICYVDLSFPTISLEADLMDKIKQNIAFVILGQLRNSRLFRLLRYQKGLVYDVRANASAYPGIGNGFISLEVGCEYSKEAVELAVEELDKFRSIGPTPEELTFAKNYLANQWLMAFDHPTSIASWVENHLLWDDSVHLPEDYADMISDITGADLVEVMQKYWDFSKLNLTIQGPISGLDALKKDYTKILNKLK